MAILHVLPSLFNSIQQNPAYDSAYYQFYGQFKTFGVHAASPPIETTLKTTRFGLMGPFNLALIAH